MSIYVSMDEYLMGRAKLSELDREQLSNINYLVSSVNNLLEKFHEEIESSKRQVTSGYRPSHINSQIGGSAKSSHMLCAAVDLQDTDGELSRWCIKNIAYLQEKGLYMEDPRYTRTLRGGKPSSGWLHLQIRPTKRRIFMPSATAKMVDPDFWDGRYDKKYDQPM